MATVYLMQHIEGHTYKGKKIMNEQIIPALLSIGMKICGLTDDSSEEKIIKRIPYVEHMNEASAHYRRMPDGIYKGGMKTDYKDIAQNVFGLNIPINTFIVEETEPIDEDSISDIKNADKIILVNDSYCEQDKLQKILSCVYYLSKFVSEDFSEEDILGKLYMVDISIPVANDDSDKNEQPVPLEPLWKETKEELEQRNCEAINPKTRNILSLRMESGLTRKDFARYLSIPYRTIENWEKGINKCPDYVYDLIEYRMETDDVFKYKPVFNSIKDVSEFLAFWKIMVEHNVRDIYIFEDVNALMLSNNTCTTGRIENFKPDHACMQRMIDYVIKKAVPFGDYDWNPETHKGNISFRIKDEELNKVLYIEIVGKNSNDTVTRAGLNKKGEAYIHLRMAG